MLKVLLVEDDKDLVTLIRKWLEAENCKIDVAYDGLAGCEYALQGLYDVIVLDWDLPGLSGVDICRRYRGNGGTSPILMLTGKGMIQEKSTGFSAGADDYLTKPFHMQELSMRLVALSKRVRVKESDVIKVGCLELDPPKHLVKINGKSVHLMPREFDVLEFLIKHPDQVFSSEALLQRIWGFGSDVSTSAIRTTIRRIRQALGEGEDESESMLENVRRVGYRLRTDKAIEKSSS